MRYIHTNYLPERYDADNKLFCGHVDIVSVVITMPTNQFIPSPGGGDEHARAADRTHLDPDAAARGREKKVAPRHAYGDDLIPIRPTA